MRTSGKYYCDEPDCKSIVELADPKDVKNPRPALEQRGWTVVQSEEDADKHFCPTHSQPPTAKKSKKE